MKTTTTSGGRKEFKYEGSLQTDYKLFFEGYEIIIPSRLMFAVLENFSGQTVIGGFNRDDAPEGGIGLFVQDYSEAKFEKKITSLNGTHIVAILRDEGFVNVENDGNKVVVTFKV